MPEDKPWRDWGSDENRGRMTKRELKLRVDALKELLDDKEGIITSLEKSLKEAAAAHDAEKKRADKLHRQVQDARVAQEKLYAALYPDLVLGKLPLGAGLSGISGAYQGVCWNATEDR